MLKFHIQLVTTRIIVNNNSHKTKLFKYKKFDFKQIIQWSKRVVKYLGILVIGL